MRSLYLFLSVLVHIDVSGYARCITIVGEHLGGEVNNAERVDTATTQFEMIHGSLGGGVVAICGQYQRKRGQRKWHNRI